MATQAANTKLYTSQEVADILGISATRVRTLARVRKIGQKLGRDWVFARSDIDAMRDRPTGRPPKSGIRRPKRTKKA